MRRVWHIVNAKTLTQTYPAGIKRTGHVERGRVYVALAAAGGTPRSRNPLMKLGFMRTFSVAIGIAVLCLLGAIATADVAAVAPAQAGGQAAPAQNTQEKPLLAGDVFKSVMVFGGIPVDTFFETMGMFANAMGDDCTFCHSSDAVFNKAAFAEPTPRIQRARQMIAM